MIYCIFACSARDGFFLLCITLESLLLAITHHITNVLKGAFVLLYHFPLGDESLQHDGL